MKMEDIGLPSFGPIVKAEAKKYAVKYLKVCLDDAVGLQELQVLETKGLEGKDVIIIARHNFDFQSKFFVVINYMEKLPDDSKKKEEDDK